MWDKFRKTFPKIAAALSAVKAWGSAILGGKFADAGQIAKDKYNAAKLQNKASSKLETLVSTAKGLATNTVDRVVSALDRDNERAIDAQIARDEARHAKAAEQRKEQQAMRREGNNIKRDKVREKYGLGKFAKKVAQQKTNPVQFTQKRS